MITKFNNFINGIKGSTLVESTLNELKLPNILYHGSKFKFDFNSLQLSREGIQKNNDKTGSSERGYGFYVTKDLWTISRNPLSKTYDKRLIQPLYKEGTFGHESAEKYAGNAIEGSSYIYAIELADDINLDQVENIYNVEKTTALKYLEKGIHGSYNMQSHGVQEVVVFTKDKIKSLKLIYYADKTMLKVSLINYKTEKLIFEKIIPHNLLEPLLKQTFKEGYFKEGKDEFWPKDTNLDNINQVNADPKLNYIAIENNDWPNDWQKYS